MAVVVRDRKADAEHAAWWVKTYCPHMACPGSDQQTLERMTTDQQQTASNMLQLLDDAGLVRWDGYQPKGNRPRNFILLNLEAPMESQNEWLSAENRRLTAQVEQLMRDLHAMDGQRERAQQLANSMAAAQDVVLGCDSCGLIIDDPRHYSGTLNGVESGHIHLCQMCSAKLPLISVTTGGKPFVLEH